MRFELRLGVLCTLLLLAAPASAQPLFSFTSGLGGTQPGVTDRVFVPVRHQGSGMPALFENLGVTPADVGRTFTVTRETDPDFDAFTALLRDGVPQMIAFGYFPSPAQNFTSILFTEPQVVWGNADDPRVDLRGWPIDAYTVRINSLEIINRMGASEFHINTTFFAVPEPSAAAVVCLPAALLVRRRR